MLAFKSLQVTVELYRRGIWSDDRTVNILALASLAKHHTKLAQLALNFFIGRIPKLSESLMDDDVDVACADGTGKGAAAKADQAKLATRRKELAFSCQVAGSSKSKRRKLDRLAAATRKANKAQEEEETNEAAEQDESQAQGTSGAVALLNDPQGFAEKLLQQCKTSNAAFEHKLLMMNVLSRVIGYHLLLLPDFYTFLARYIHPSQKEVLKVLAYAAQATHDQLPAKEVVNPALRIIANAFVANHNAAPIIAAGINGIREICTRCPDAIDESLLQEMIEFASPKSGNHDKGVTIAARSLLGLYRRVMPELLPRKDRGREASMQMLKEKRQRDADGNTDEESTWTAKMMMILLRRMAVLASQTRTMMTTRRGVLRQRTPRSQTCQRPSSPRNN